MNSISFALNQILFPDSPFENFISFSKKLNVKAIEIRNDIKTNLIEENDPIKVKNICEENSIKILSINALQKFNFWNKDREKELILLCKYADKANIDSIVLVPLNDGSINSAKEQKQLLEQSLKNILRVINDYNVLGLVEPLGFTHSSLRFKSLAAKVINNYQSNKLKIVHDTFHHALAGENEFFPLLTGLVHISGVSKNYENIKLLDSHRSIIDDKDMLGNINQIKKLCYSNYQGFFSLEPFSHTLIKEKNIFKIVKKNFNYIDSNVFN